MQMRYVGLIAIGTFALGRCRPLMDAYRVRERIREYIVVSLDDQGKDARKL